MKKLQIPKRYIPKKGQSQIYIHSGKEYCIIDHQNEIYVIDNLCPHQGASLGLGEIKGEEIICPLHQWKFNFKTGKCNVERFSLKKYEVEFVN